jgi:hypothetical protein
MAGRCLVRAIGWIRVLLGFVNFLGAGLSFRYGR